jgi:hypothetical protein
MVEDAAPFRVVIDTPQSGGTSETRVRAGAPRSVLGSHLKDLDFEKVKKDWTQCLEQVRDLAKVADTEKESPAGFRLTEIDLGLTITAEGHLAFVASASASAMLQVKFTR